MKKIVFSLVICASVACFGAADGQNTFANLIKVTVSERSELTPDLAIRKNGKNKIIACLIAGKDSEEGTAQRLLEKLRPLNLTTSTKSNQYAKIKEAASDITSRVAIIVIERMFHDHTFLYMRVLNETTSHCGGLNTSLYCKLSNAGTATIRYEEAGMSEEIWREAGGLASDELGFEINYGEIRKLIPDSTTFCPIL